MTPGGAEARCGTIAIVGRPNVGKSTLLNALVGQKISITSRKAQTTRHRIVGVRTRGAAQFVFVDTPGFQTRHGQALNRNLNRAVRSSLGDVDLVLLLVEAGRFGPDDARVVELLPTGVPVILVANKLDTVRRRGDLLPWLQKLPEQHTFAEYVPMSAERSADVERLLDIIEPRLPQQAWIHDPDALTDRNERFLAGEIVREKLFRLIGDELPYTSTVVVDRFEEEEAPPRKGPCSPRSTSRMFGPVGRCICDLLAHCDPRRGVRCTPLYRCARCVTRRRCARCAHFRRVAECVGDGVQLSRNEGAARDEVAATGSRWPFRARDARERSALSNLQPVSTVAHVQDPSSSIDACGRGPAGRIDRTDLPLRQMASGKPAHLHSHHGRSSAPGLRPAGNATLRRGRELSRVSTRH